MKKILFIGALSALLLTACGEEETATITPDEFKKLETGMSTEEVKEIVGGKPKNPDAKESDDLLLTFDYDGENGVDKESSVSLIFKDGKLNTIIEDGLIEEKVETAAKPNEEKPEKKITNVPKYKIEKDDFGKGMWRVTLSTPSTDEKELKKLVEETKKLALDKYKDVSSIWVNIKTENSVANTYAATAKVALDDKGKAATGLSKIGVFEFKYNVDETHKTSKDDLQKSNVSYNADDVLKAFQNAGLSTPEPRDNSHNCVDLGCTKVITTEAVSIYEWPSEEKAKEVFGKKFGTYQVGTIIIRMNDSSLDATTYNKAVDSIVK